MDIWSWLDRLFALVIREKESELARLGKAMDAVERRLRLFKALRARVRHARKEALATGATTITLTLPKSDSTLEKGATAFPVTDLEWTDAPDGVISVTVNKQTCVPLTLKLAELLGILEKQPIGPDGFPMPLKLHALAVALGFDDPRDMDTEEKQCVLHAVTQRLTRLQDRFGEYGLNPYWIDRNHQEGVRLLIHRSSQSIGPAKTDGVTGGCESHVTAPAIRRDVSTCRRRRA